MTILSALEVLQESCHSCSIVCNFVNLINKGQQGIAHIILAKQRSMRQYPAKNIAKSGSIDVFVVGDTELRGARAYCDDLRRLSAQTE